MSGRNLAVLGMVGMVVSVVLVLLVGLLSGGTMMGWGTGSGMMGWGTGSGMMGWGGNGFTWWGIMMLLVGALAIGGVVWLSASLVNPSRHAETVTVSGSAGPLDILKERYARGELTSEEYDRMRVELER